MGDLLLIHTVPETGSTNADLLAEAAAKSAPEGTWLRAERQVSGRGRLGRDWHSPAGNLYASTIVRLAPGDPEPASLALVTSVALCETALAWGGEGALFALKWPNDLMAGPAKMAGILLERTGDAVVIGCGVNLAHHPEGLDRPTASFASLGLAPPDPAAFLEDLAPAFARWLRIWREQGLAAVRQRWLALAHPIGAPIATMGEQGLFDGLEADGALRMRRADGTVVVIHAGDVALL